MATEFRVVRRYSQPVADLERSEHVDGASWRNWRLVTGALPLEIALLRADCGNGLITDEDRKVGEIAFGKKLLKQRRSLSKSEAA